MAVGARPTHLDALSSIPILAVQLVAAPTAAAAAAAAGAGGGISAPAAAASSATAAPGGAAAAVGVPTHPRAQRPARLAAARLLSAVLSHGAVNDAVAGVAPDDLPDAAPPPAWAPLPAVVPALVRVCAACAARGALDSCTGQGARRRCRGGAAWVAAYGAGVLSRAAAHADWALAPGAWRDVGMGTRVGGSRDWPDREAPVRA